MTLGFPLLEQALKEKRAQQEAQRLTTLATLKQWLHQHGAVYGISRAYIFGSLIRPYQFHKGSDVDLAIVDTLEPDRFFAAIGAISEAVERDVDLIELFKHPAKQHFYQRICQQAEVWSRLE